MVPDSLAAVLVGTTLVTPVLAGADVAVSVRVGVVDEGILAAIEVAPIVPDSFAAVRLGVTGLSGDCSYGILSSSGRRD